MTTEAHVNWRAYNGFGCQVMEPTELDDAREAACDFILRARRYGHTVTTLKRGHEWEIQTQMNIEGSFLTDADGYLTLTTVERPDAAYCSCCDPGDCEEC